MKKRTIILSILLLFQFLVNGQEYTESEEFILTKYDTSLFEKMFSSNEEFNGNTLIYITDNRGNKLKEIEVFIETYENDSKVEELITTEFKNINKIIRVVISQCACYCDTSKYYFFVTNDKKLIELPTIEQEDYEFGMKTKDYVFNAESETIELTEFQDEMIKKNENDNPTFKLKSKKVLKKYKWNGNELNEK
ncbi:hypothetical protein J4050_08560 [Winogradskyella sp. DF17]|uniref:Uncharacterized protein n=1 Tax=Winogradskyella pelagia TaxID=2819984 RepID=A0ABS3T225_9FLAO|nr:hypothetical protein [Winogradskyella sp. DF17]MBO3116796.1 hypothetical protein [Winogradskyella sp. DF17]